MTVNAREYHRTFKILRNSGRMPTGAEIARNADRESKEARAKYPGTPANWALHQLHADKARIPVHDAFEETGNQYRTARIEEKNDQQFEKFATPWELIWSRLVMYWKSRLIPVVDSSGLVVAYAGDVNYKHILIDPASHSNPGVYRGMKNVEVLKHYRLFVGTNEFYGRSDLELFGENVRGSYPVVTDIYGEVMYFEFGGLQDDSISSVSLLEIAGAFTLVRGALGLVVSLGKTGLRTLVRRPPTPLSTMGANETLTGAAVSRGSRLPARHLTQRTIIAGGDEELAALDAAFTLHAKRTPGIYDIVIHGNQNGFAIMVINPAGQLVSRAVSPRDVADAVRPYLKPGDQIRLIACDVGKGGGIPAQELAELLKRAVWAPTNEVFPRMGQMMLNKNGQQYFTGRKSFVPLGSGQFRQFSPTQSGSTTSPPMHYE